MEKFDTKEEAIAWVVEHVCDGCVDNERFAFTDDHNQMSDYQTQKDEGCCGDFDAIVLVGDREATVGCNYGH